MRGDPKRIDPYLLIQNADGKILAEDDDSGGFPNALIVFAPTRDDEYKILASVFKAAPLGPFKLRIREESGRALGPRGLDLSGRLSDGDPNDPLMNAPAQSCNLILKKGTTYAIDMKSKDFDPYLRLENMAGLNLKTEDVGGNGHSTLVFAPPQDGIYRLIGTSFDFKTGPFTLAVREGPPAFEVGPQGFQQVGALANTDPPTVILGKAARCKIYTVRLKAGQRYRIDLVSNQFDTYLIVQDSAGAQLAADDDSGGNLNARLVFEPTTDGVYRLVATHFDGRLGLFQLLVRPLLPENEAFWRQRAQKHLKAGEWDQAMDELNKAIQLNPPNGEAWNERGIVYFRKQIWDKAEADFSTAIEKNPNNAVAWGNRGDVSLHLGQWDKALADLTRALELNPKATALLNLRGVAHFRKKQWDKAVEDFSRAIEQVPNNPLYWNNRGNSLGKLGQWEKAVVDYSKSIALKPDHDDSWLNRGDAHASLGQWDKASEDLAKAMTFPNTFAVASANYALVRLQLKDLPGYRQACGKLKDQWTPKHDPQYMTWVCTVGPDSGVDLGPFIQALETKVAQQPRHSYPDLRALGAALYRSGKAKEAIKRLQEAASRKEPSASVWLFLAMANHQLGQRDEAQKWLEKACSYLAEVREKNADADPKAMPWPRILWTERVALELTRREAEELLGKAP
jgi:tetratricopeptide (TPR) repeat protein